VHLVSWSTAINIEVGELFLWLVIRVLVSVDCEVASRGLCGVWKTQGCGAASSTALVYEPHIQLEKHPLWIVRHKASRCKTTLDILLCHPSEQGLAEAAEEPELAHVVGMRAH
jgi:hypothetical protein